MPVPDASGLNPWIPFFSVLGGAAVGSLASFGGAVVVQWMTLKREREHKASDHRERLWQQNFDFYAKTLLELQDALEQLFNVPKVAGELPPDETFVIFARLVKLLFRVDDDALTKLVNDATAAFLSYLNDAPGAETKNGDWWSAVTAYQKANAHIGMRLRDLGRDGSLPVPGEPAPLPRRDDATSPVAAVRFKPVDDPAV